MKNFLRTDRTKFATTMTDLVMGTDEPAWAKLDFLEPDGVAYFELPKKGDEATVLMKDIEKLRELKNGAAAELEKTQNLRVL